MTATQWLFTAWFTIDAAAWVTVFYLLASHAR